VNKKKPKFEDCLAKIDEEINKRRGKWGLTAIHWIDFDDVAQIIRIHIYNKWHLYKPENPLGPWLNIIINNQIKNLIRNNFGNFAKPCLKCSAYVGENECKIYKVCSSDCPYLREWNKNKKTAYNLRITSSIDSTDIFGSVREYSDTRSIDNNFNENSKKIHEYMYLNLKPHEYKIYDLLYIQGKNEKEAAKILGFKTSERNRRPGYKHIKNVQKIIIAKIKLAIAEDKIDIL
jgi:RNA polymerase sigma factor (sigma-70 family)